MILASIHQPQYIPWVPYFDKILQSDVFIFLDSVQFQKNGVQNRNQIKMDGKAVWLTVPVRQNLDQTIAETKIANPAALKKHLKSLEINYRKAPFFTEVMALLEGPLSEGCEQLSRLNVKIIKNILSYLDCHVDVRESSAMSSGGHSTELLVNLCCEVGAEAYLSGQGGRNYLDLDSFRRAGVELRFQNYSNQPYPQFLSNGGFIENLSIVDLLFNCGPDSRSVIEAGRLSAERE